MPNDTPSAVATPRLSSTRREAAVDDDDDVAGPLNHATATTALLQWNSDASDMYSGAVYSADAAGGARGTGQLPNDDDDEADDEEADDDDAATATLLPS